MSALFLNGQPKTANTSDVYSYEETRIGTWVDGKPLYRKAMNITLPKITTENSGAIASVNISSMNIDKAISCKGYYINTGGVVCSLPHMSVSGGNINFAGIGFSPTSLTISGNRTYMSQRSGVVTLEYTKTTD